MGLPRGSSPGSHLPSPALPSPCWTHEGAAEGHRELSTLPAPRRPLSGMALQGCPGTLAPSQRLRCPLASPRWGPLSPLGRESQALVLGPLAAVRVPLLWGLQSLGCENKRLSVPPPPGMCGGPGCREVGGHAGTAGCCSRAQVAECRPGSSGRHHWSLLKDRVAGKWLGGLRAAPAGRG